jgi:predicted metal-binding protein
MCQGLSQWFLYLLPNQAKDSRTTDYDKNIFHCKSCDNVSNHYQNIQVHTLLTANRDELKLV